MESDATFPEKLRFLFAPARYKVAYGGRGGAKSWGVARALLILGAQRKLTILCAREIQKSIGDSVHKLLREQVMSLALENFYQVQETSIRGQNGTEFIFAGLKQNINNLKSYEGCDICWVEEAHTVSKRSWDVLIPTIRKDGSEIWVTFNPELETDETYRRFVLNPPPGTQPVRINWRDNPWFPEVLRKEMEALKLKSADDYEHVYEGTCKQVVDGAIYKTELLAAEKSGRIMRVPYDKTQPVQTFWDLGWADLTSCWFVQAVGLEFRLIDYLDGSQQSLHYYLKALADKPYIYSRHCLPHDAKAHSLGTGRTIEEQFKAAYPDKVEVLPQLSIEDGIAAARALFDRCVFDTENCAGGLQALRHYRYEQDEKLGTLKRQPLHDWASHGADAFRQFAVAVQEPARKRKAIQARHNTGPNGWMS